MVSCSLDHDNKSNTDSSIDASVDEPDQANENPIAEIIDSNKETARDIWQNPELVLQKFGQLNNKVIADIGAGTGYFSLRMLPLAAKIIAVDIDESVLIYLDSLRTMFPAEFKEKLETRLVATNDPGIKNQEVDGILISNTYIYIENRAEYLLRMKERMKPNATLLIVDYKKRNLPVGPPKELKISISQLEDEIEAAGFVVDEIDDQSLKYQYILKARKP